MAYTIEVTISTGNKVSLNYQSQEVGVSLTYRLEREDEDVLAVIAEKSVEVVAAHQLAWEGVRAGKSEIARQPNAAPTPLPEAVETASPAQKTALRALLSQSGWSAEQIMLEAQNRFGVASLDSLSLRQTTTWLLELQKAAREKTRRRVNTSHSTNSHREPF